MSQIVCGPLRPDSFLRVMSDDEAEQPLPRTLVSPQRPTVAITDPRRWIVAAGHLEKAKPESSFRSGWGKRYFVLTHSHLFWFKKDDPYEELFGSERNKVKVRDIIASGGVEVRPKQSGDEFAELHLRTNHKDSNTALIVVRSKDEGQVHEWAAAIQSVSAELRQGKRFTLLPEHGRDSLGALGAPPTSTPALGRAKTTNDASDTPATRPELTRSHTMAVSKMKQLVDSPSTAGSRSPPALSRMVSSPNMASRAAGGSFDDSDGADGSAGAALPVGRRGSGEASTGSAVEISLLQEPVRGAAGSITNIVAQTGIRAMGFLQKQRDGAVRSGWSTRFFVLARRTLYYFKVVDPHADLFGEERGRWTLLDILEVLPTISRGANERIDGGDAEGQFLFELCSLWSQKTTLASKMNLSARMAHRVNELGGEKEERRVRLRSPTAALSLAWIRILAEAAKGAGAQSLRPLPKQLSYVDVNAASGQDDTETPKFGLNRRKGAAKDQGAANPDRSKPNAENVVKKESEPRPKPKKTSHTRVSCSATQMMHTVLSLVALNACLHLHTLVSDRTFEHCCYGLNALLLVLSLLRAKAAAKKAEEDAAAAAERRAKAKEAAEERRKVASTSASGAATERKDEATAAVATVAPGTLGTVPQVDLAPAGSEPPPGTWSQIDGTSFRVRTGPNYKKNGKKLESKECFYECVSVDLIRATERVDHVLSRVKPPAGWWPAGADAEAASGSTGLRGPLPPVIVMNCQLPYDAPQMFGKGGDDRNGASIVYVFRVKAATQARARDLQNGDGQPSDRDAALRLFMKFCNDAGNNNALQERLKAMGFIDNISVLGLSPLVTQYNGKPVLVTKSGTLFRGEVPAGTSATNKTAVPYLEIDVNVHRWAYLPRKALHSLRERMGEMLVKVGFVVQAETDEEMPECIFACAAVNMLDIMSPLDVLE
eukprot:g429.t1